MKSNKEKLAYQDILKNPEVIECIPSQKCIGLSIQINIFRKARASANPYSVQEQNRTRPRTA